MKNQPLYHLGNFLFHFSIYCKFYELNWFFRRLSKGQFEQYAIPPAIIDLALNYDDTSKLPKSIHENLSDARISSNVYIEKFSTLIHMEEAANSKHLATFDLKNVQISIHSRTGHSQLFKFCHGDYHKYYRAWRKGTIDAFIVKSSESEVDTVISGQIYQIDTYYILFKVLEGFEELVCLFGSEAHFFNITFNINRIVYQLQHNALKWIKEHNLFSILIDNPRYELTSFQKLESEYRYVISEKKVLKLTYNYRYYFSSLQFCNRLNEEQKNAVKHIVQADKDSNPFILFGPPGKT